MKKLNPKLTLILGIVFLLLSGFMYWKSSTPTITSEETARCEELVQKKYNNDADSQLLEMCTTSVGWVAQHDAEADGATSAEEIAKAISTANQSETGSTMFSMFFVGLLLVLGLVLSIKGIQGLNARSET